MRIWTLHRKYLDRQGLLALWREGLLAQAVLLGRTRGYVHHPQPRMRKRIPETRGQLIYEWSHLRAKLRARSPEQFDRILHVDEPDPHPLFDIVPGEVREWEKRA